MSLKKRSVSFFVLKKLKRIQAYYEKKTCPEIPFFGASYPDATCIDGELWDLDACDEGGLYSSGDNPPCPFCRTLDFLDRQEIKPKHLLTVLNRLIKRYDRVRHKPTKH